MKQAIVYIRFSTLEQREGASTDRQMERTTAMCEAHGWDVEKILTDEGKSAFKGSHRLEGAAFAAFEREAIAGVHAGKVLVIERLSRLSRLDYNETYDLMRSLTRGGVTVATWDGDKVYRANESIDFVSVIELLVKAKTANEESQTKSDFGKDKWERRRRDALAGKIATKNGPAWLTLSADRKWQVIEDRAALVRRIFEMADAGDGALRIARRLNEDRAAPWPRYANRTPLAWDRKFIGRILSNPAVIGDYIMCKEDELGRAQPVGEPVRAYYPRIVEPDLFERVRLAATDRKAVKGGGASAVVSNLMSGLLVCDTCGGPMEYIRNRAKGTVIVRDGKAQAPLKQETANLFCRSAGRKAGCTNRAGVAYVGLERALLDHALHLALDDAAFSRTDEVGRLSILIADKRRDHEAATAKAKALWNAYTSSQSEMAMNLAVETEAAAKAIGAEIETLETERGRAAGAATAAEHLSRLATIREHLNSDDLDLRRTQRAKVAAGLRSVIEDIVCYDDRTVSVHFKHVGRAILISPGAGRRPAAVREFDLHKHGQSVSNLGDDAARAIRAYEKRVATKRQ